MESLQKKLVDAQAVVEAEETINDAFEDELAAIAARMQTGRGTAPAQETTDVLDEASIASFQEQCTQAMSLRTDRKC